MLIYHMVFLGAPAWRMEGRQSSHSRVTMVTPLMIWWQVSHLKCVCVLAVTIMCSVCSLSPDDFSFESKYL